MLQIIRNQTINILQKNHLLVATCTQMEDKDVEIARFFNASKIAQLNENIQKIVVKKEKKKKEGENRVGRSFLFSFSLERFSGVLGVSDSVIKLRRAYIRAGIRVCRA